MCEKQTLGRQLVVDRWSIRRQLRSAISDLPRRRAVSLAPMARALALRWIPRPEYRIYAYFITDSL